MGTDFDKRFKRTWEFFQANAFGLLLGTLAVLAGSVFVIPAPWFAAGLLQEILECLRTGRTVRWQATYERPNLFFKSWGLALAMGLALAVGFALCFVPGVLLAALWLYALPLLVDGRGVFDALSESGRLLHARGGWGPFIANWFLLLLLNLAGSAIAVAVVLTLPLSMVYLGLCYLEDSPLPAIAVPTGT